LALGVVSAGKQQCDEIKNSYLWLTLGNAFYHTLQTAAPGSMVDHVLGQFSRSERKVLDDMLIDAVEAIEDWIEDDNTDKVMNRVNAPR
jgi:peptidyl-tRNA hydrolase